MSNSNLISILKNKDATILQLRIELSKQEQELLDLRDKQYALDKAHIYLKSEMPVLQRMKSNKALSPELRHRAMVAHGHLLKICDYLSVDLE